MTTDPPLRTLQADRDHAARICADLLHRGHVAEAKRWAKESERCADQIRAQLDRAAA